MWRSARGQDVGKLRVPRCGRLSVGGSAGG
jgi:hypothetical protein